MFFHPADDVILSGNTAAGGFRSELDLFNDNSGNALVDHFPQLPGSAQSKVPSGIDEFQHGKRKLPAPAAAERALGADAVEHGKEPFGVQMDPDMGHITIDIPVPELVGNIAVDEKGLAGSSRN